MHLSSVLPMIALPIALAKDIPISVGKGGLVFNPEAVTADVGDLLQFSFYPKNHSVAQGSLSAPCQPLAGGVYSGFMPVEIGEGKTIFEVTVNSTDAIYLYCSQTEHEHCQNGMAMVVNPPSTGNTLAAYQTAAKNTTSKSPPAIAGGVFIPAPSNSTANATTSSTTPTSSPTTFQGSAVGMNVLQSGFLGLVVVGGCALAMI